MIARGLLIPPDVRESRHASTLPSQQCMLVGPTSPIPGCASPLSPLSPVRPASAVVRVEMLAAKPLAKQFGVRTISKTKHDVICVAPPHAVATWSEREDATEFVFDVVILASDLIGAYGDLIRPVAIDFAVREFALTPSHRKSAVGIGSHTCPRSSERRLSEPGNLFAPVRQRGESLASRPIARDAQRGQAETQRFITNCYGQS
jgi:hypothetical protein